ncbi:TetR/AcrR family transcriptional regulator [Nocardioides sp. NPDC006273]|uniref:TetR/AcrR family transcriptional regulator n=1 Tax=Nocardioides sp. NPDC006273 TaxID=3155598 RepID=UPI0033AF3B11
MESAFAAFGTVGYWNTTMAQIAQDCGVTRAGLLHHFATKESLLAAVLEHRDEVNRMRFFDGSQEPRSNPRDFLERMIALVEHNASQPGLVSLFAVLGAEATHPNHPANGYFHARYESVRSWIGAALEALADAGQLRDDSDPVRAAIELTALLDGLQIQWLYQPTVIDMPAQFRARVNEHLLDPLG